ncbi:MAG: hypothetical protein FWC97_02910 [Treponema sp.]|nr:hypothetical protein [Treponema sp.]
MRKTAYLSGIAAIVILLAIALTFTGCFGRREANVRTVDVTANYVEVTAQGSYWANRWVQGEQFEIELTVVFNEESGEIVYIDYTPTNAHISVESNETFFERWVTPDEVRPATYRDFIDALIGMTASDVAEFSRPPAENSTGGEHMITGFALDAVSGATETGRNLVSSVVLAAQQFLAGEAVESNR